ncbi:MAG: hypothetical protein EOP06_27180, partial [Proteobacteria bacterium]
MELLREGSRKAAWDLIQVAERHYHLNIKGGLIGLNLLRTAKGYKMGHEQARSELTRLWQQTNWHSRESIMSMVPFIVRAYGLVPQNMLHDVLDKALMDDGLRIRDGELRR